MSDLFASGNSIGGSGPGGAGSSGRGAGGAGEYGKGPGGVGEYGTGAGGAGTYGSGAGGSGVGVNNDTTSNYKKAESSRSLWDTPEPSSYENEILNSEVKSSRQAQSNYRVAEQAKEPYTIKSPIFYFLLNLLYPVIYIPLVLLALNFCIVLIASVITGNPLGTPFIWITVELVGICFLAYLHFYLLMKARKTKSNSAI